MVLHCDTATFVITDENNTVLTITEARKAWIAGKVSGCNMGFQRLALYDFDTRALDEFYQSCT